MTKTACLTGITGQTGSYLAELLLKKGYKVYGLKRRSSSFNTERLDHIYQDLHDNLDLELVYGDLADYSSIASLLAKVQPDLFFNLGAQSHVRVSFDIPEYSFDVDGTGVLRCLEAIRQHSPHTRFLQASSSEMFGSTPPPQNEETPFHPRSPYAVAKVAGFYSTINYREAYDMFAVNAISFNHECISAHTPIMVKENGLINICSASDLIPLKRKGPNSQTYDNLKVEIWDGVGWTSIKCITATKINKKNHDHNLISVQGRAGIVDATAHHHMLDADMNQIRADQLVVGQKIAIAKHLPPELKHAFVSLEMAEFLGLMAAEGYVSENDNHIRFTNCDLDLIGRVEELWSGLFLGTSTRSKGVSGFNSSKDIIQLNLNGVSTIHDWLREILYTRNGLKVVPQIILNSPATFRDAFLRGYYAGDGLKAGNGESVKTNSPFLAQGLCWLYYLKGNYCSTYVEIREGATYYQLNVLTNSDLGMHLRKDPSEIRKIVPAVQTDDWVFDLETGSGVFCAGVGRAVVHNSPRRGETFVTRKVTRGATRIKEGLQQKLYMGNLAAKRDWSHAADVAQGMFLMLTADAPDDYVVASGQMHSVREFLVLVFGKLGMDWRDYVEIDPKYFRPSEVDALCGDASKLRSKLGWAPEYSFEQLVDEMIEADWKKAKEERLIKENL